MLKVSGATKGQIYRKVGIPRTMPYFFASMKVAAGGSFIGNVVGEMIASGSGLGSWCLSGGGLCLENL